MGGGKEDGRCISEGEGKGGCGIGGCGEVVVTRRSAFMGESEAANGEASRGISLVERCDHWSDEVDFV
jgi:hypothetical protein